VALHATTIRFADRGYAAISRAADAQGVSVSQYVREAALIRAVLDELDEGVERRHTAHDLLAPAREVRRRKRPSTSTAVPARRRSAAVARSAAHRMARSRSPSPSPLAANGG
jgi:hypothetical protein